jgi:ribonuclease D
MKINYNYHINDLPQDTIINGDIAVDTEAMGLNNHRDRLCLVQIADSNGSVHIIHFQAMCYSANNLKKILSDKERVKIFHYARFDLAIIHKYLGVQLQNIFCTKVASKLCRTYSNHHSLSELCMELLDKKLSKQQQISDWGKSKLTEDQLQYASKDVVYLHRIMDKLILKLKREDRLLIAQNCFKFIPYKAELDLLGWLDYDIFAHH